MRTDGPVVVPVWYECLSPSHVQVCQNLKHNCVESVICACVNTVGRCFWIPHLSHLGSYHDWWCWRCCCPPATCCRWRSLACVASPQTTDSPGERHRGATPWCTFLSVEDEDEAGTRWMRSPCRCRSPLWSLSHSPPPHWLSCCHWRRSGRGPDLQGWMGPCSRDKNYTLG